MNLLSQILILENPVGKSDFFQLPEGLISHFNDCDGWMTLRTLVWQHKRWNSIILVLEHIVNNNNTNMVVGSW